MPQPLEVQTDLYPQGAAGHNSYTFEPGVCVLPLAEEPPTSPGELANWSPVVVLQLHAPYRVRRYEYSAKKENNPPIIPAPGNVGKFVFTGGSLTVLQPALNTTLTNYDWSVGAVYEYVENCVSRIQDGFVLGAPPYPLVTDVENAQSVGLSVFSASSPSAPSLGAVSQAGVDAVVGYRMGQGINFSGSWGYNQATFLPGVFFNAGLPNGDVSGQGSAFNQQNQQSGA